MFSNVGLEEAESVGIDDGHGGRFPQRVPVPAVEGSQIVTKIGHDCPIARDVCCHQAEERGLGKREYYVVGADVSEETPLVSVEGHLGRVRDGRFEDLITENLYFDVIKMPWDLQKTTLAYLDSVDQLSGSTLKQDFLSAYDEDGDGIVTYEEYGKRGAIDAVLFHFGLSFSLSAAEEFGFLRGPFLARAKMLKWGDPAWNTERHDLMKEWRLRFTCLSAFLMSQQESEAEDPMSKGMVWGNGKWPSSSLAFASYLGSSLFGKGFPNQVQADSLYGMAFQYADLTQNEGHYAQVPDAVNAYISDVRSGKQKPLDFVFFVPAGFEEAQGKKLPNVEISQQPNKLITASFSKGREVWA
jgi:hypothetical protein